MPLTGTQMDSLYGNCSTLYTLATNFKRDVWNNNNTTNYNAGPTVQPTDIGTPTLFTEGTTSSGSPGTNATNLINGYKQIVYMTDLLIYNLWAFMKTPISDGTTSVMSTSTSDLATNLTSIIDNEHVIQVITDDSTNNYNLGFNHDTADYNILKKSEYTSFKKYVFFARDLLTLLSTNPNFKNYNNDSETLSSNSTHKVYETLNIGIAALTSAIAALETPCDTRWIVNGKYTDHNTGLYATRNHMDSNLNQLYQLPGSAIYTSKANYTATMVAGTIWTAFASALIYYIFTEL